MWGRCRALASAPEHPQDGPKDAPAALQSRLGTLPLTARVRSAARTGPRVQWVSPAAPALCHSAPKCCGHAGRPEDGGLEFVLFVLKVSLKFLFNVLSMYSTLVLEMLISPCAVVFPFRFLFSVFPFSSVLLLGKGRAVSSGFSSYSRHLPWLTGYHICIEGAEAKNRSFGRRARAPAGSAGNTASH